MASASKRAWADRGALRGEHLAWAILAFAVALQLIVAARIAAPGELAGDDNSIHLAEIAGIARALSSGDLDLWNPSANGGFASGYFYQFLPQLACAIAYVLFGWAIALSALFKLSIVLALLALPLTVYRALRVVGWQASAAAAAALGASTVYGTSSWGAGIDSLFSTGLYTQAFALVFFPLAVAYAARYLLDGSGYGRAVLYALLTGFCHPFIAVAIAPALIALPWWRIGIGHGARRSATLFVGALLGSSPLWLPIIVHYDAFGGFPARVVGEEGIAISTFSSSFVSGLYLDLGRQPLTTLFVLLGLAGVFSPRGRLAIPLYVVGALFAALIMAGPMLGKTEGDLLPMVRFLAPMQLFLAAAGWGAVVLGGVSLCEFARRRLAARTAIGISLAVAAAALVCAVVLATSVNHRSSERVRTVNSFPALDREALADVISFLASQPPGRVFAASEFGSGSHWWMYLPYVYADRPAIRAYGGAALQSSPNFVFLRALNPFRDHAIYATRYLVAHIDDVDSERFSDRFDDLAASVIYDDGGYRIYGLDDHRLFRAVEPLSVALGDREAKTNAILEYLRSLDASPNRVLVEDPALLDAADPSAVTIGETRHSRREHRGAVSVAGTKSALIRAAVSYHPGWRARVDGSPAEVHRVSPALVAVLVPPGEHVVELKFVRPLWTWLLYLGLLGAAIAYLTFVRRRRPSKRATRIASGVALAAAALLTPRSVSAQPHDAVYPVDAAFAEGGRAVVATTGGLYVRKREGEPFAYVCAEAVGSRVGAFSPRVAIRTSGSFAVTSYNGLRESGDGCAFDQAAVIDARGELTTQGLWFADVSSGPDDQLWAGTADSRTVNDVFLSQRSRQPWRSLTLESDRFWYISVLASPRAVHLYASGYMVAGHGAREIDKLIVVDGEVAAASGLRAGRSGRIRVILAPSEREVLVVAEDASEPTGDVVYQSKDAGQSFEGVLRTPVAVVGAARDSRGATWVASQTALYRAPPGTARFERALEARLSCLAESPDGEVIACHGNATSSGVILSAIEQVSDTVRLVPTLRSSELSPPCGANRSVCARSWDQRCRAFGADCHAQATEPLPFEPSSGRSTGASARRGRLRLALAIGGAIAGLFGLLAAFVVFRRWRVRRKLG